MPAPTATLASLRPDLAGSFMEYDLMAQNSGFIATEVFPVTNVAKASGTFGKIPIEQLLQTRNTDRAPGANYSRGNWTFTTDTYACEEHGAEEPVDDNEAAMYSDWFDAEQISAARAMSAVLRNAEIRMNTAVFNATTWTSYTTGITHEWDDAANAVPITDVEAAVQSVYDQSGLWANALIIGRKTFRNLRICASVIERISSDGAGSAEPARDITKAQLSRVFDLDHIIVGGTTKNTATEGQSASLAHIWDPEYAMVCRVAETSDIREPCIGRTFHWADDGSQVGGTVESYRDESIRSEVIRVRHQVAEKVLYVEAGHLLSNITTI